MTYKEAHSYLMQQLPMFQRIGAAAYRADLGNITKLCEILGQPQSGTNFIHVAGTNGKGSVVHIIAALLQAQGYKVGVFASPHYRDYRERIKINGSFIAKAFVARFTTENLERFKTVNASFFEMTTAMAFAYFKEKKVDFAVMETGMGGRLDSTNIIRPLLSVITNISLDHTQFLGDTLEKIAAEKAGIIKTGVPVVIGESHKLTKAVFTEKARQAAASITFADKALRLTDFQSKLNGCTFLLSGKKYRCDLSGDFQQKNITTALAAIEALQRTGVALTASAVRKGLRSVKESTYFTGRWMVMGRKPLILFDSAHNEGGIKELMKQVRKLPFDKLHFVYGTVADKDLSHILPLLPGSAEYYFCRPAIPRGKEVQELLLEAGRFHLKGRPFPSVRKAYRQACIDAAGHDLVLVSGSIFVVAELL